MANQVLKFGPKRKLGMSALGSGGFVRNEDNWPPAKTGAVQSLSRRQIDGPGALTGLWLVPGELDAALDPAALRRDQPLDRQRPHRLAGPDSPTIATVSRGPTSKEAPRTNARQSPSRRNDVTKFETDRTGPVSTTAARIPLGIVFGQ
jgi:hypothetical protein